jgi:hypothetical protein
MNFPGYDEWKNDYPSPTPEEEEAAYERYIEECQNLRTQIAAVLTDERGDIYLADVRRIVVEELNKLAPKPGEPAWQTKTPVPVPKLG